MTRFRTALVATCCSVVVLLLAAPSALAWSTDLSAGVTRGGVRVGSAKGTMVVATNGWAFVNVRALSFRAPSANGRWRARTIMTTSCVERGFDPAEDDPNSVRIVKVTAASQWRITRLAGTKGTITTNDMVKECPAGLVPGGSLLVRLQVQHATTHAVVGNARLFAAG